MLVRDHARGVIAQQQRFRIGRLLVDRDAHVVERGDDRFHRRGFGEVIRQVVVDLGVRQVAAFLAQLNERAHLALTLFILLCGHCDIGLHRAGLALPLFARRPGALRAGATTSSPNLPDQNLPYFLLDRFARRRQIPGSERNGSR